MSKPIFLKNRVEQTINLKEVFGVSFKGKRSLKEAIGGAIIEQIRSRVASGKGIDFKTNKNGTPFNLNSVKYSKKYLESDDAKSFGKKPSPVNMTLTGDMLGLMDIKKQSGDSITIGWSESEENAKAYNHSVGDTVKRRPFFGISTKELKKIKENFQDDIKAAIKVKETEGSKAFEAKVADLVDDLSGLAKAGRDI